MSANGLMPFQHFQLLMFQKFISKKFKFDNV